MIVFETKRMILRLLSLNDIDNVMTIWGDIEVMKYCGGTTSRERELQSIEYYIDLHKTKGFSPYVVVLKNTNEVIGVCGFNPPNHNYDAELMYHFSKAHWKKGYATEATSACLEYAKERLHLTKIGASIDPENIASQHVLKKIGFTYVGLKWCEATKQQEPYFEYLIIKD